MKNKADLEEKLDEYGVHAFRSVLAKVRWPVSHVVPELAYGVSSLAQTSPQSLNWDHVRRLNLVVKALKKASDAFDASFAKEPGMRARRAS